MSFTPVSVRHALFDAMPDIKDFRSHFTGFQLLKYDETVICLFITDFLAKAIYRLYCDPTVAQFRPSFMTHLRTAHASARYTHTHHIIYIASHHIIPYHHYHYHTNTNGE